MEEKKSEFNGYDDSEFEQDMEDLRNHKGRFSPEMAKKRDVRPGESLWDYIKRKEKENNDNTTL